MNRTGLGVVGSVNQTFNPRVDQRARAHCARFNCNKQLAVSQTMVANYGTRLAESDDFRMGRGIVVLDIAVPAFCDDLAFTDDDRPHRNLTRLKCTLRGA